VKGNVETFVVGSVSAVTLLKEDALNLLAAEPTIGLWANGVVRHRWESRDHVDRKAGKECQEDEDSVEKTIDSHHE
jgi:hypothetical protein